jgi:hypothetical protein
VTVAHRGGVGREGDQLVEASGTAIAVAGLVGGDFIDDFVGVAVDTAVRELAGDDLVQPRSEGLDERVLIGRPRDVHVVAGVRAAQPGLQHEDDLVQWA